MNFLIPILDFQVYGFLILSLWCLGSSNLASHIYSRFFINKAVNPLSIQCLVKALICLAGLFEISIKEFFSSSTQYHLISIPIGLGLGWMIVKIELMINRLVMRKKDELALQNKKQHYYRYQGPTRAVLSLSKENKKTLDTINLKKLHEHYASHERNQPAYPLMIILAIAIFEEIIFRGYLVHCCHLLPHLFVNIALILTIVFFGISHASFGLGQIMAKTILGSFCMAVVLIFQTLVPAFIIHGYLNWVAFKNQT